MTKAEVNKFLSIIEVNYRNAYKNMDASAKRAMVQIWTILLHDIPIEIALLALFQLLSRSKWPPSPAELREQACHMHYEAEELLRQTSFMETLDQYSVRNTQNENTAHLEKLKAIARDIIRKTEHLSRGLNGNDSSLTLSAMINTALLDNPSDTMELRALIIPGDVLPESDYPDND